LRIDVQARVADTTFSGYVAALESGIWNLETPAEFNLRRADRIANDGDDLNIKRRKRRARRDR